MPTLCFHVGILSAYKRHLVGISILANATYLSDKQPVAKSCRDVGMFLRNLCCIYIQHENKSEINTHKFEGINLFSYLYNRIAKKEDCDIDCNCYSISHPFAFLKCKQLSIKNFYYTFMLKLQSKVQSAVYLIECFLQENYEFRHNLLSGKTEFRSITENGTAEEWSVLTQKATNSIVRKAKMEGISKKSPRTDIEEYINSDAVKDYDPIREYLNQLPAWDGKNHVAELFNRIPGLTSEQLAWCSTWLRSAVVHWLGMEELHGNECTPILIGRQGCGKTTFSIRLLPPSLRCYYMDHIYFANKFDADMALTNNLLVNIDEFANMRESQQGKLKQTLSKQKVNGRPIFGRSQEDRRRYASFIATTNDEQPLCDPTGSRRFICLKVPDKMMIDNEKPIEYEQLYAQVMFEIMVMKTPHWFTITEEERIQQLNQSFMKEESMENMIGYFYKVPNDDETGNWLLLGQIIQNMNDAYPQLTDNKSNRVKIGQALRMMGCLTKETRQGMKYQLMEVDAA